MGRDILFRDTLSRLFGTKRKPTLPSNDIDRFVQAQKNRVSGYKVALNEIRNGHKESHWIWYIFPQLKELGHSPTAQYYGIKNKQEAKEYLQNDLLRKNLIEISEELYKQNDNIRKIVGD